ncbi:hypothetical protein [Gemmatimonas sp.]|uniref:hypothetical protein n=1 Tax=Gemmatimonas sp. TaxID=1962908 RepID=UPI003983C28B
MNRLRAFSWLSFVLVGGLPSVVAAQAIPLEVPRVVVGDTLRFVIPSSARLVSLGVGPRGRAVGTLRGWLQDSQRTDQPVPVVLRLDSITPSALECPMPVARRAPETILRMPVASGDSTGAPLGVVKPSGCTNPLDRRP